jgi:hypothetical protein
MARGSFWDELGKDRERHRRAEVARLRAEAQIRKDGLRAGTLTARQAAALDRADGEAKAAALQAELDHRVTELCGLLRTVVAFPVPTIDALRDLTPPTTRSPTPGRHRSGPTSRRPSEASWAD